MWQQLRCASLLQHPTVRSLITSERYNYIHVAFKPKIPVFYIFLDDQLSYKHLMGLICNYYSITTSINAIFFLTLLGYPSDSYVENHVLATSVLPYLSIVQNLILLTSC